MAIADFSPTQARIVAAAARCFARAGVQQTTIGDIAAEAGVVRKTVYRLFGDRQALIVSMLRLRSRDVIRKMQEQLPRYASFAEALVEAPLYAMRLQLADGVFQKLVESETSHGVNVILMRDPDVEALLQTAWSATFVKARLDGVLRSALPDSRLIEGAASLAAMLALRADLDEAERRRYFQDFLVPAILGPGLATDATGKPDDGFDLRAPVRSEALAGDSSHQDVTKRQ